MADFVLDFGMGVFREIVVFDSFSAIFRQRVEQFAPAFGHRFLHQRVFQNSTGRTPQYFFDFVAADKRTPKIVYSS